MVPAVRKWGSVITFTGIILTSGLTVSTVSSQPTVKQQVFRPTASKSYTEIINDKMNHDKLVLAASALSKETEDQTKNQENSVLNEQLKTKGNSTKASSQVKSEESPTVKTSTKQNKVLIASNSKVSSVPEKKTVTVAEPKAAQQVSRGSSEVDNLIKRAMSLQGVPYLWGGTTRKGFDCSGFVQYVFKASGVTLPRTSFEQFKVGTPVSRDQLKPGDLVFFSTYKQGASDVRIYIGGGRTIGSASEGVGIHSLSESYWAKRYIGARRVF